MTESASEFAPSIDVTAALEAIALAADSGGLRSSVEGAVGEPTGVFLVGLTSAALGAVVAWTAYRGYVRNDSRPMLFLALGVALLTTVPFVVGYLVNAISGTTDAHVLLAITACHLLGLVSIVRALGRV